MAFDINKVRESSSNLQKGGRFNIDNARNFGRMIDGGNSETEPLKANAAFGALREQEEKRKFERTQVRLPFSQRSATMGGANNFLTRGFLNMTARGMESLVAGGFKVAATAKGENIETNRPIVNEPNLTGGDIDVQTTFEPMNRAAISRIEELDIQRPNKRFLNLLQGTTEEVFLPLLDAVDIVGLGSLAVRLTRKLTFSKEATEALSTLNMGLLSDTSETGVRTHISNEVQKNVDLLARERITPEVFATRLNGIGTAFDTLTEAPTTRFGRVGERINSMATALEMERKIGRATDPTFIQTKNALQEAMNKADEVAASVDDVPDSTVKPSADANNIEVKELTETGEVTDSRVVSFETGKQGGVKVVVYNADKTKVAGDILDLKKAEEKFGTTNRQELSDKMVNGRFDNKTEQWNVIKETDTEGVVKKSVASTDERPKSKLALRINEALPDGNKIDEFYDAITIKGELDEAGEAITKNPTKALTEALDGGQPLPKRAARLMEFAQAAKDRGDTAVQSALLSKMRVLGTDIAQGLNMFKAFGLSNPETEFLETVMAARLKKIAITAEDISRAGSHSKAYNAKVYAPVKEEINNVTKRAFKVADAQKLFDDLTC